MRNAAVSFFYHRSLAPLMWVFVALAGIELAVVHFLLSLWSPKAAIALSLFSMAGIAWLVSAIRSFRHLPVLLEPRRLILRTGRLLRIDVDQDDVAGLRARWTGGDLKDRSVLNLALLAYPNVVIDLKRPIEFRRGGRSRTIRAVALKLDDPARFRSALPLRDSLD